MKDLFMMVHKLHKAPGEVLGVRVDGKQEGYVEMFGE